MRVANEDLRPSTLDGGDDDPDRQLELAAPRGPTEAAIALSPSTLLYIEDNSSNLRLIELVLATHRPLIKLLSANHGEAGIASALEHQPDLVLLDLQLPDLNGGEVLKRLQNNPRTSAIPIVMISADATSEQSARIMSMGARCYLTKPLDIRQLLLVIDGILSAKVTA